MRDAALWVLIGLSGAFGASMVAVVAFALTTGFRRVEDRLGRMEDRFVRVEDRLRGVEDRLARIEVRG
jgi:uncharacterized membrane protein YhiD involved in acid resistance